MLKNKLGVFSVHWIALLTLSSVFFSASLPALSQSKLPLSATNLASQLDPTEGPQRRVSILQSIIEGTKARKNLKSVLLAYPYSISSDQGTHFIAKDKAMEYTAAKTWFPIEAYKQITTASCNE